MAYTQYLYRYCIVNGTASAIALMICKLVVSGSIWCSVGLV